MKRADMGMAPWEVFHTGISNVTNVSLGNVSMIVGLTIIVICLFIKVYPGIGTVLNIICIGMFINILDDVIVFNVPTELYSRLLLYLLGFVLINFGMATYMVTNIGKGPRDGLFIGLIKITGLQTKYMRPIIEITVTLIGIMLGGAFGFGTIFSMLFNGYAIQFIFKLFKFDPKEKHNSSVVDYFKKQPLS